MEMQEKHEVHKKIGDIFDKFSVYQIIQYIFICTTAMFMTMININYIFAAGDIEYRCQIPQCEGNVPTYNATWWPDWSIDRCKSPVLKKDYIPGSPCTGESFTGKLQECNKWVYETNNTVIAELDLACRPWLSNLIGTIHSSGMLLSMIIAGWMADRFGRKTTLIICVVASFIGQLKTVATSYYMYVVIEFIEAAVSGGSYTAAMVIMLEICDKKNRILSGVIFACAIYLGELIFACIAMFVPYWKTLIHIINGPSIFFLSFIFIIRESPRWQILNSKTEEAKKTLLMVANMNKVNINRQELAETDDASLRQKFNIGVDEKREGYKAIVTSKVIMKRLLVTTVCRFTSTFVYYGLMINSVFLPGDKYTNFLLATLMSFPGELMGLYLMNRIGRKVPLMAGYILCGILCMLSGYVPPTYTWLKITVFLIGKAIISACFTGAITYMMELFPTSARGTLLGIGSVASRFGGLLAPLTPILNPISEALPSVLFGCSAILSGVLLTITPETKDLPLMDTIHQVEQDDNSTRELKKTAKRGNDNHGFSHC